jgi:Secretion system C-terminal sorting domain
MRNKSFIEKFRLIIDFILFASILMLGSANAQSAQIKSITNSTSSEGSEGVYEVQPGTAGNQIVLEIANVSKTTEADDVEIKLVKQSKFLKFSEDQVEITQIDKNKETEAAFNFDVDVLATANTKDTLEFQITGKGVNATKSFILKYSAPKQYALYQNYPNPFNPTTTIRYSIPASLNPSQGGTSVQIKVYDILGREVTTLVNEEKKPGNYEVKFDASNLSAGRQGFASGVYIYRLTAGNFVSVKKMMLLK